MKAIIDTCFIDKFYKGTDISDDFSSLMSASGFELLIHPYVYEKEISFVSHLKRATELSFSKKVDYSEFIKSEAERLYYQGLFISIYNEFYSRLLVVKPDKANSMHFLDSNTDVFSIQGSASSFGDVHMVLMAVFMEVPIILSEDSDMKLIYDIAKTKVERANYQLELYKIKDVIEFIKSTDNKTISNKELKRIRRAYD